MSDALEALQVQVASLEHRIGLVEDAQAIARLHNQYGYYLDKTLYEQVVDLFVDEDARVHFLHGVFHGKEGVKRLYLGRFLTKFAGGRNGPRYGKLLDHPMMQPVITVDADRLHARGRFRTLMSGGTHESEPGFRQWWEGGIYENEYVKEGGQWKIRVLNFRSYWQGEFDTGWSKAPSEYTGYLTETFPDDPDGPDEIVVDWAMFPHTEVMPFHYPHPVTGEQFVAEPYVERAPTD